MTVGVQTYISGSTSTEGSMTMTGGASVSSMSPLVVVAAGVSPGNVGAGVAANSAKVKQHKTCRRHSARTQGCWRRRC